jgi:hypothetical protein
MTGNDRMLAGHEPEAVGREPLAEPRGVLGEAPARRGIRLEEAEHRERRRGDDRCDRVGEEIGPGALAQPGDDLRAPGYVAAARAAKRLAERAGEDVHAARHAAVLVSAAAARAHEAGRVRVVDDHGRTVPLGELTYARERRGHSVH